MMAEELSRQLILYDLVFKLNRREIVSQFPLPEDLTQLTTRGIIAERYESSIAACSITERSDLLITCMLQEKNVAAFENFIAFCDENKKELADYIRRCFKGLEKTLYGTPPTGKFS